MAMVCHFENGGGEVTGDAVVALGVREPSVEKRRVEGLAAGGVALNQSTATTDSALEVRSDIVALRCRQERMVQSDVRQRLVSSVDACSHPVLFDHGWRP